MLKHAIALSALVLFGSAAFAQQTQKPVDKPVSAGNPIPAEARKETNPVKPTAASQAQAKKTYGYDCAMCHGADGDGKGDLAVEMKLNLPDYRDPAALKDVTDGEIFYIIKNGKKSEKSEMPSEGDRAKPDEIWNLVIYVRSFARKDSTAKPKPDTP
ncbi:MAG: c-type cytochrome [Candidatus Acidiferrales bacterium]